MPKVIVQADAEMDHTIVLFDDGSGNLTTLYDGVCVCAITMEHVLEPLLQKLGCEIEYKEGTFSEDFIWHPHTV